jgi:hypothetical protein
LDRGNSVATWESTSHWRTDRFVPWRLNPEQPDERRLVRLLLGLRDTSTVIDQLKAATEALNRGDPEPFASLFADDAEWRGVARGHLWWKQTPS